MNRSGKPDISKKLSLNECPFCKKWKKGLLEHITAVHVPQVLKLLEKEASQKMLPCECGAYRLSKLINNKWVWAAGCQACDRIKMLEETKITIIKDSSRKQETTKQLHLN